MTFYYHSGPSLKQVTILKKWALFFAWVAEMVDARDVKSAREIHRAGAIPGVGIIFPL